MARDKRKITTVEGSGTGLVLTQQPEAVVAVGGLAAVIAKTLALCGRTPGLSWRLTEQAGEENSNRFRVFAFKMQLGAGLSWESDCWLPPDECDGPEFEARLAAMVEKVYAGAAAELANCGG